MGGMYSCDVVGNIGEMFLRRDVNGCVGLVSIVLPACSRMAGQSQGMAPRHRCRNGEVSDVYLRYSL